MHDTRLDEELFDGEVIIIKVARDWMKSQQEFDFILISDVLTLP